MNPYEFANIFRPTIQSDWRAGVNKIQSAGQDYALSRAIYRAVTIGERLPFRRKRSSGSQSGARGLRSA